MVVLVTVSFQILLNSLVKRLCRVATRWENHKTVLAFESAYVSKVYLLTLTNMLTPLLLIAFYIPRHHADLCMGRGNCLLDL